MGDYDLPAPAPARDQFVRAKRCPVVPKHECKVDGGKRLVGSGRAAKDQNAMRKVAIASPAPVLSLCARLTPPVRSTDQPLSECRR